MENRKNTFLGASCPLDEIIEPPDCGKPVY